MYNYSILVKKITTDCDCAALAYVSRIEHLDKWCRDLRILYLQSNLISKIGNNLQSAYMGVLIILTHTHN